MKKNKKQDAPESKLPGIVLFEGDVARETRFLTQEEKGFYLDFILAESEFGPMTSEELLRYMPAGFEKCANAFDRFVQKAGDKYYIPWVEKALDIRQNAIISQKYPGYVSGCKRNNTVPMTREEYANAYRSRTVRVPFAFSISISIKDRVISGEKLGENNTKEIPPEIEKAINENSQQVLPEIENLPF